MRGEEVVIARAGEAQVRLAPIAPDDPKAKRKAAWDAWIGRHQGMMPGAGDLFSEPEYTDEELDAFEARLIPPE